MAHLAVIGYAALAGAVPADPDRVRLTPISRGHCRFRVQSHRATSEVMVGAYPYLAEAGLGSEGTFSGRDAWSRGGFCFDPWVLYSQGVITNPNCLLAGVVGRGKSCLAKALATRSIAFGRRFYVCPATPRVSGPSWPRPSAVPRSSRMRRRVVTRGVRPGRHRSRAAHRGRFPPRPG